jgi:hypothetical protein
MRQATFWLAVAGVSLLAPVGMNVLSDRLGPTFPAIRRLNDYTTRRNG